MRRYMAFADTGRDFIEFVFNSEHRANSKGNYEDAIRAYRRMYGYYNKNIKIKNTRKLDTNEEIF